MPLFGQAEHFLQTLSLFGEPTDNVPLRAYRGRLRDHFSVWFIKEHSSHRPAVCSPYIARDNTVCQKGLGTGLLRTHFPVVSKPKAMVDREVFSQCCHPCSRADSGLIERIVEKSGRAKEHLVEGPKVWDAELACRAS